MCYMSVEGNHQLYSCMSTFSPFPKIPTLFLVALPGQNHPMGDRKIVSGDSIRVVSWPLGAKGEGKAVSFVGMYQ